MNSPTASARVTLRVTTAVFFAALAVRLWFAHGHELWFDDVARLRLALLPWGEMWGSLAWLDNFKTPYLVMPHKLWDEVFGHGSLLAIRGWGAVSGAGLAALATLAAGRACNVAAAVCVGAWYVASPFFIRWSVEVHNYAPAALCLAAAVVLLLDERVSAKRQLLVGALCGYAAGTFVVAGIPAAWMVAVACIRDRSRASVLRVAGAAAAVFLPAALFLRSAHAWYRPALEAGPGQRLTTYYFNVRKTPFEVLGRMSGLNLRQGAFSPALAAAVVFVLGAAVLCCARSSGPARPRRLMLLAAGPLAALFLVAACFDTPAIYDRYTAGTLPLLPAAVICALVSWKAWTLTTWTTTTWTTTTWTTTTWTTRAVAAARSLATLACGLAFLAGVRTLVVRYDDFPAEITSRSYRAARLVDTHVALHGLPDVIAVHGEALACEIILRSEQPGTATRVRHLTTPPWVEDARSEDLSSICVPAAAGWPFCVAALVGGGRTIDRSWLAERASAGADVCVVLENGHPNARWYRADEERLEGLAEAWELAGEKRSRDRDARMAELLAGYLRIPPDWIALFQSDGRAFLIRIHRPE